jgi:DNA polymerase-1
MIDNVQALQQLLPELGFTRRVRARVPKAPPLFTLLGDLTVPDPYTWMQRCDYQITDLHGIETYLVEAFSRGAPIALDTETTSLNRHSPDFRLVGLSVSTAPFSARYLPVSHLVDAHLNMAVANVKVLLDALGVCPLIFHHAGFDLPALRVATGWQHPAWRDPAGSPLLWEDTLLLSQIATPHGYAHGLKHLAATLLGTRLKTYTQTVGDATLGLQHLSPVDAAPYACADADATFRLFQHPSFATWKQHQIYRLERAVTPVLADALDVGIHIDTDALTQALTVINADVLAAMDAEFYAACGSAPFDLDNPDTVGQKLLAAGVPLTERTKTGQLSTHKLVLSRLSHPLITALNHNREWHKFWGTYVQPVLTHVRAAPLERHPLARFPLRQLGAPTGRMAGGAKEDAALNAGTIPTNIQSWPDPKRRPDLPNLRTLLIDPRPDWQILSIDYSQIELRIAANRSMEPRWIDAYLHGRDLHQETADTLKISRTHAKTINFAILYGAGAPTIATRIGRDIEETQELLDAFFASVPLLHGYIQRTVANVRQDHQVATIIFTNPEASKALLRAGEREAVNTTIQGSAADIFKAGLVRLRSLLRLHGLQDVALPCLFIHDEVNLRVHVPDLPRLLPPVLKALEFPASPRMPVPLIVEAELGPSWGHTQPLDLTPYRQAALHAQTP